MSQSSTQPPPLVNLSHSILTGGTFIQHNVDQRQYIHSGERSGYKRLLEHVASAALHNSGHVVDPPKCHPNTRVAILESIIGWKQGLNEEMNDKPMIWLKGGAGAGKSAIARSVAERCSEEGLLLGTFFFGAADSTRNHVGKLVATLSYQISIIFPAFRDAVSTSIEEDPMIFDRSLRTQFTNLLLRPLSIVLPNLSGTNKIPRLIIIDGLDECSASIDSQRDLLFTLQEATTTTPFIRFLVCSRPENHLNSTFGLPRITHIIHTIFLGEDISAEEDIRLFLEDKFKEIREGHIFKHTLPTAWPRPEMVDTLVSKSSGQFIYAATVIKYIESPKHRPHQRLDAIFQLRPAFKDLPFKELDALYRHIISQADNLHTVLDIFQFIVLYGGFMGTCDIEMMLQLEQGDVEVMLADLHSIVNFRKNFGHFEYDSNMLVKFQHKSLADFLSEPQRAGDLYRDISASRVLHISRLISIFSGRREQETQVSDLIILPIRHILVPRAFCNSAILYTSSDILQVARQFPIAEFSKPLLTGHGTQWEVQQRQRDVPSAVTIDQHFLGCFLDYLGFVKYTSEAAWSVYLEQVRKYCKCVLSVLEDHLADDWKAHFVFAYYHLLHDSRHHLPRRLFNRWLGDEIFAGTIWQVLIDRLPAPNSYNLDEIPQISHDLTEDIKQKQIFALAASFCIDFLCDERRFSRDANHRARATGINRRKMGDHPWCWHHIVLRRFQCDRQALWINYLLHRRITEIPMPFSRAGTHSRSRISTFQLYLYYKTSKYDFSQHFQLQEWSRYVLLMDLIPYILPLAGRYEPLVAMCKKKCLASISQFWPKESRRVRREMDRYLRRVDSQEVD
ncbi:hypothetical protein D9613_004613 [Agrocybe pediades]|uniref:Nephrocystin 3-like N-terminal domain-containing protein n=1 Tax=Agrocybe pediades TaxID=84607 RepID=A0A8H4VJP7_9AGAR|nr:hypothetical protein D9613_004613 [Agrocybe pediades]